ncbi:hypothetical protein N2152v2_002831 [Parachlorella kessleri]
MALELYPSRRSHDAASPAQITVKGRCRGYSKEQVAISATPAERSIRNLGSSASSSSGSLKDSVSGHDDPVSHPPCSPTEQPQYGVHYQRYALRKYLSLPLALRPFVLLPGLRDFLVIGRPTMDTSGGLASYRNAVPKAVRARQPFLVVVDKPGAPPLEDSKYCWVEFPLPDVFKLDVSGMVSFERDYVQKHLKARHRRAYRVRQQELVESPITIEYFPLKPGSTALVDEMWALYLKNGRRHGFHVLSKSDFYRIHLGGTPGLSVMLARDNDQRGRIVTFCTGVRTGDTLMSMWCGTDYDNPLSRSCSTYINCQYEFVRIAIQDQGIRWLDLGAQLRQMKTGVGAQAYPVSGYLRCKSRVMRALSQKMMKAYFQPAKLMTDA